VLFGLEDSGFGLIFLVFDGRKRGPTLLALKKVGSERPPPLVPFLAMGACWHSSLGLSSSSGLAIPPVGRGDDLIQTGL
jgi:hypothetical protein